MPASVGAGGILLADKKGFFKEEGIEVEYVFTAGGGETVQALIAGGADIGMGVGLFAVLSAMEKGAPIRAISNDVTGMEAIWYVRGDSPLKTIDDLAGKKVCYSREGASSHITVLALGDLLKGKGLKASEAISCGGVPDTLTAVKTGQADVGWGLITPLYDQLTKGELRIIFKGNDIPAIREMTMRVNIARADFVEKNPEVVRGFLRAIKKALDLAFQSPREVVEIWNKETGEEVPLAAALEEYKVVTKEMSALAPIKGLEESMKQAVTFKFLAKPLSPEEVKKFFVYDYAPR